MICSTRRKTSKRARGICIAPYSGGALSPIRFRSRWRNTMPPRAARSVGPAATRPPRFHQKIFFKTLISPARANTSNQLSTATISTKTAGGCDQASRSGHAQSQKQFGGSSDVDLGLDRLDIAGRGKNILLHARVRPGKEIARL